MIAIGAFRILVLGEHGDRPHAARSFEATQPRPRASAFLLLLRAFASGAVALTGTEAIATGVPGIQAARGAERRDDPHGHGRDPRRPVHRDHVPGDELLRSPAWSSPQQTVIAQVAQTVYGDEIAFYLFQAFTALLLFLAANTRSTAFPRLLAVLAEDGFFPRQFALRGDRLAYSAGSSSWPRCAALVVRLRAAGPTP